MHSLSDEVSQKIDELAIEGNQLMDVEQDYYAAIDIWKQALAFIPVQQEDYSETVWLETSIGDAYFQLADFGNAFLHFDNAYKNRARNTENNPFIMLRLGQTYFENHLKNLSLPFLLKAYNIERENIFQDEDEKYLHYLLENIVIE